jgi:uncharacterized protein (DUF2141 family)
VVREFERLSGWARRWYPLGLACLLSLLSLSSVSHATPEVSALDAEVGARASNLQRVFVELADFRSDQGEALVALFRGREGFPKEPLKAEQRLVGRIHHGKSRVVFDGLTPGEFAISVLHDEDADHEVRTGLFGIPREGLGFSRDPRIMFGPPKFKEARLELRPGENPTVSIHIRYF